MRPRPWMRTCCVLVWAVVSGLGLWALTAYNFTPSARAEVLTTWPADTSLMEATHLIQDLDDEIHWIAVLQQSAQASNDTFTPSMTTLAAKIPGLTTFIDKGSVEARRFGARTSGEVLLFGPDGKLRFHGGLTRGRGHEGVSIGTLAVRDWVRFGSAARDTCNVYGCQLSAVQEVQR